VLTTGGGQAIVVCNYQIILTPRKDENDAKAGEMLMIGMYSAFTMWNGATKETR
jgi:hypothetical protein